MKNKAVTVIAVVAFGLLCVVGRLDYEDAVAEEALYCNNVKNGTWPDYDGIYADVCEAKYGKAKKVKNISI